MSDELRNYLLAALAAILVIGVGWYGYQRLYVRYHQAEPPSKEPPTPRVERPCSSFRIA